MSITISYKKKQEKSSLSNLVFFVNENYDTNTLKKHLVNSEYNFVKNILKTRDKNVKILSFDLSSGSKIILVALKKNYKSSDVENLGAEFYLNYKKLKQYSYSLFSDTIPINLKSVVGHFLHGLKLKSYKFEKYKTKKNKVKMNFEIIGKNITSVKEQERFRAIEEGTFYARDLVSEPGNILHPDEYAKRGITLL